MFNIKTSSEVFFLLLKKYHNMKHIQESIIGRKGMSPSDWHTGDLAYMNVNGPNRPGNINYVWVYLDKFEAKKRIDEFETNKKLQGYILAGKSVFVQPGAVGSIRCDYEYVGQNSEKFLFKFAQELIRMDRLNLDPKKTILENLEENNYGL